MKVYILSDYGEYGAENVMATTDKTKLPQMLTELGYGNRPDALKNLNKLLEDDINTRDGSDLENGWGGSMLHIVDLV